MAQLVKMRMRKPLRVYTFLSRDLPINRHDRCVVKTERGLEFGQCVVPPEECNSDEVRKFTNTVVRLASHHDEKTFGQIKDDEKRARSLCIEKIKSRKLAMKLVECEYSFDRKKVIFYFTAEERVDFRELVKDLAQEFKARIELRHIQVRDEAKIIGGIGTCGRELCCTTWMKEFMPISMKMAKKQNLSLNPTKISGQCGRLMCCLSYENDQYTHAKRNQPREAPKKEDLEGIRNKMESEGKDAAETIIRKEENRGRGGRERRPREDRRPRDETAPKKDAAPASDATEAPKTPGAEGDSDRPRKRRRRRRK